MAKVKFYAVWEGRETGIFNTWDECKEQVDRFKGAKYKSFKSRMEAEEAYENGLLELANKDLNNNKPARKKNKTTIKPDKEIIVPIIPAEGTQGINKPNLQSISVDAACSGNPGIMQYRGVHTQTGQQIFYQEFKEGTNNIGEFLAIVHALVILKKRNIKLPLYTDSKISMSWIRQKKCKTNLKHNSNTEKVFHEFLKELKNILETI